MELIAATEGKALPEESHAGQVDPIVHPTYSNGKGPTTSLVARPSLTSRDVGICCEALRASP